MTRPPPRSTRTDTLFPYTTLFRSLLAVVAFAAGIAGFVASASTPAQTSATSSTAPTAAASNTADLVEKVEILTKARTAVDVPLNEPRAIDLGLVNVQIGRASCRERVVSTCRSRWSPYHSKKKKNTNSQTAATTGT